MLHGQPWKRYECPEWLLAYLNYIEAELDRVMWNNNQQEYDSPFGNTGNTFKNDVFEVQAYSWDEDTEQPYNFKWTDVELSWYKHSNRGTTINQKIGLSKGKKLFEECLASVRAMEKSLF